MQKSSLIEIRESFVPNQLQAVIVLNFSYLITTLITFKQSFITDLQHVIFVLNYLEISNKDWKGQKPDFCY